MITEWSQKGKEKWMAQKQEWRDTGIPENRYPGFRAGPTP